MHSMEQKLFVLSQCPVLACKHIFKFVIQAPSSRLALPQTKTAVQRSVLSSPDISLSHSQNRLAHKYAQTFIYFRLFVFIELVQPQQWQWLRNRYESDHWQMDFQKAFTSANQFSLKVRERIRSISLSFGNVYAKKAIIHIWPFACELLINK